LVGAVTLKGLEECFSEIFRIHVAHELQHELLWSFGVDECCCIAQRFGRIERCDVDIDFEERRFSHAQAVECQIAAAYLNVLRESDLPAYSVLGMAQAGCQR